MAALAADLGVRPTLKRMFCPKCGAKFKDTLGRPLECERGGMPLSADLERRLRECYVQGVRMPRPEPLRYRVGDRWFCPGCGVRVTQANPGDIRCPKCERSLGEFIYALVELHPHAPVPPDTWL